MDIANVIKEYALPGDKLEAAHPRHPELVQKVIVKENRPDKNGVLALKEDKTFFYEYEYLNVVKMQKVG